MKLIDLRSDTVTHPTEAMRSAMAQAEVGDDQYEDDPTVNRLQEMSAALMGMEAGLFVASGTMGNLAAVMAHCDRGDEAIMGNLSHAYLNTVGGIATLGGINPCLIPNQPDGTLKIEDIQESIRREDVHHPTTRLIILENTHNLCGGVSLTVEYTRQVGKLAQEAGLRLHLDGARIFNAAVDLGVDITDLVEPVDSVMFCLSKALAAPIGSMLCGSAEFIYRARRIRQQLGGGMRQVGVLAATGIVAIEQMLDRLEEDHRRAKMLAERMASIPGLMLEPEVPTNMIYITLPDTVSMNAYQVYEKMRELGVLVNKEEPPRIRLVTHYQISDEDIEYTVEAFKKVLS